MGRLWKRYVEQLTHPFEKGNEFLENGKLVTAIVLLIVQSLMAGLYTPLARLHMQLVMEKSFPKDFMELESTIPKVNYVRVFCSDFLQTFGSSMIMIVILYVGFKLTKMDYSWQKTIKAVALSAFIGIPFYFTAALMGLLDMTLAMGLIRGAEFGGILLILVGLTYQLEDREKKARLFVCSILLYFILSICFVSRFQQLLG